MKRLGVTCRHLRFERLEIRTLLHGAPIAVGEHFSTFQNVPVTLNTTQHEVSFIEQGDSWKYLDDGSDQGVAWRQPSFDDSTWSHGLAQLGYGEHDETTLLSFGSDASNKHITYYFRKEFQATEAIGPTELELSVLRDDGAVVYINGTEVSRVNMPAGEINYRTTAEFPTIIENVFEQFIIPSDSIRAGSNTIAVEIHQQSPVSNDISFDLRLKGNYASSLGLLANDTDADGDPLSLLPATLPQHGTVTLEATGGFTYQPHPAFRGTDTFGYLVTDGALLSNEAFVTIEVQSTAPDPETLLARDDSYLVSMPETSRIAVDVLQPPNGTPADMFGDAVKLSGDQLFIGARFARNQEVRSGRVTVFDRTSDGWNSAAELLPLDPQRDSFFGHSLDVHENRMIVGARLFSLPDAQNVGAAYIFERDTAGNWVERAKLLPPNPSGGQQFGVSVAIEGDWAAAGAWGAGQGNGAVYIYRRHTNGTWAYHETLIDDTVESQFGWSVAMGAGRLFVGAIEDSQVATWAGAVDVFELSANQWRRQQTLRSSDSAPRDYFGYSLDVDGDRLLVGANQIYYDLLGDGRIDGSAYLFEFRDGQWSEITKLVGDGGIDVPQHGLNRDHFGASVALSGDMAIVWGKFADPLLNNNALQDGVFVYQRLHGAWMQTGRFSLGGGNSAYEDGMDLLDGQLVTGDTDYLSRGRALVWQLQPGDTNHGFEVDAGHGVLANDDLPNPGTSTATTVSPVRFGILSLAPDGAFTYRSQPNFFGIDEFHYEVTDGEGNRSQAKGTLTLPAPPPPPGVVRGRKWNDVNGDGLFQPDLGEHGLAGWTIFVDDNLNGVLDVGEIASLTAGDGTYELSGILPGMHTIVALQRSGWEQTYPPSIEPVSRVATVPVRLESHEGDSDNVWPFALNEGSMRHQQIYAADQFFGQGIIDEIRFRLNGNAPGTEAFELGPMDLKITLAYASRSPLDASRVFADNIGSQETVVFDGTMQWSGASDRRWSPENFNLKLDVADLFHYDPRLGDLIVDLSVRSAPDGVTLDAAYDTSITRIWATDVTASVGATGLGGGTGYGLVTQFSFGDAAAQRVSVVEIGPVDQVDFGNRRDRSLPRPPEAREDHYRILTNGVLQVAAENGVLANDSDPNGERLSAHLVSSTAHGELEFAADGSFAYRPERGFSGIDQFTYQVLDDSQLLSAIATVNLHVGQSDPSAVLVVTQTVDEIDSDPSPNDLSLREALQLVQQSSQYNTIQLLDGTYQIGQLSSDTDAAAGDFDVSMAGTAIAIRGLGAEQTIMDGAGIDRLLELHPGTHLLLQDMTVRGGLTETGLGGGLLVGRGATLDLFRVRIENNRAATGGGVAALDGSTLYVTDSQIMGNESMSLDGGGVFSIGEVAILRSHIHGNSSSGRGGGVALDGAEAMILLRDSAITDNVARLTGGGISAVQAAEFRILNTTVSGNSAQRRGGGVDIGADVGQLTIDNSTIAYNQVAVTEISTLSGGGMSSGSVATMRNSIVANNQRNLGDTRLPDDLRATFTNSLFNAMGVIDGSIGLNQSRSNHFGSAFSPLNLQLQPLTSFGSTPPVHPLASTSPAVDAGDSHFAADSFSPPLDLDQRRAPRLGDVNGVDDDGDGQLEERLDMGAFEFHSGGVRGRVWNDQDGDGLFDLSDGELPMANIHLRLVNHDGIAVAFATTDSHGDYAFNHLFTGRFSVVVELPTNTVVTRYRNDLTPLDNDFVPGNNRTPHFDLQVGNTQTFDAGLYDGIRLAPDVGDLRVSELQAFQAGADFIELQNLSDKVLDLTDVRLIDGISFAFTENSSSRLFPGEYVTIVENLSVFVDRYQDDTIFVAGEYTGRLDDDGDDIHLLSPLSLALEEFRYEGEWYTILDPYNFSLVVRDELLVAGDRNRNDTWRVSTQVGGSPGRTDPRPSIPLESVVINEVMARPSDANDWIELLNIADVPIDISGWYLGNDVPNLAQAGEDSKAFRVPTGTVLTAGASIVFDRLHDFGNPDNPGTLIPFGVSSYGESLHLIAVTVDGTPLGYSDSVEFRGSELDKSLGRFVNVDARGTTVELISTQHPTPNATNSPWRAGPLLISELFFHAESGFDEYVELLNTSDDSIRLAPGPGVGDDDAQIHWQIEGDINWHFSANDAIPAHGFALLVAIEPSDFRAKYQVPSEVPIFGPYLGQLPDHVGDVVLVRRELETAAPSLDDRSIVADHLGYDDRLPWPIEIMGGDRSIERRFMNRYGNNADVWLASSPGGTPGQVNSVQLRGDLNGDGRVDAFDIDSLNRLLFLRSVPQPVGTTIGAQWDLDHNGWIDHDDLDTLLGDIFGAEPGDSNLDGVVDGTDFNQWLSHRGSAGGWSHGDFDGSGGVDEHDLDVWLHHRFTTGSRAPRIEVAETVEPDDLRSR